MKSKRMATITATVGVLAVMGGWAIAAQDKYTVLVPNGLSFGDFRATKIGRLSPRATPTPQT
jgi:hypothetical protein